MKLLVRRAGFLTAVQDLGRAGHRSSGIPPGGALDPHVLRVANLLVGNDETLAGLELTLGGARFGFEDERVIAWGGGRFEVRVEGKQIPAGRAALVRAGEELIMTPPSNGARAWLAIAGGINVPLMLGSRSTDLRSEFGGLDGRALRDGDVLELGTTAPREMATGSAPQIWSHTSPAHPYLRVIKGIDQPRFHESAWAAFFRESFTVAPNSDRMGVRLHGPKLARANEEELISEPVAPGTIQVPPNGDPILLLGDCQTIGGYPKIAHVITVDLPTAAQLAPGDIIRFAEISLAAAHQLLLERTRDLQLFKIGLSLQR